MFLALILNLILKYLPLAVRCWDFSVRMWYWRILKRLIRCVWKMLYEVKDRSAFVMNAVKEGKILHETWHAHSLKILLWFIFFSEPLKIVKVAKRKGLDVISITDHDNMKVYEKLTNRLDIIVVRGMEIKTDMVDITGLFLNISHGYSFIVSRIKRRVL